MELKQISIDKIKPNPFQPREEFKKEELQELSDNIKKHGMIEPIVVTKKGMIVAGERRWRANKLAKQGKIWVIMKDYKNESDIKRDSLIENEMRENLSNEEFKTFCFSLAKSLKYPIDKNLPWKLSEYITGKRQGTFYHKIAATIVVEKAPRKIQKLVERENIDLDTAARIARIEDKEAREEVIGMVQEKSKAEPGVTPKITSTAIRNEIKRKNIEAKAKAETERFKQEQDKEEKKITERNIINKFMNIFVGLRTELHSQTNLVYPLSNKRFIHKFSHEGKLELLDSLKLVKKEVDRTKHIIEKIMEMI